MNRRGVLYIVSTPIGNLRDMSLRAIDTLNEVDWIAAEDTRHSAKLLDHFQIATRVFSLHEHNETSRLASIKKLLDEGKNIALISDAGTPLVSDPGFKLVRYLREEGYEISSIPGACAAIAALSISGLPSDRFFFEGFLPVKTKQRKERLSLLETINASIICYEAPHRVLALLGDIEEVFGEDSRVCLARELTKKFETVSLLPIPEAVKFVSGDSNQQKGEYVVVIDSSGSDKEKSKQIDDRTRALLRDLAEYLPPKKAASLVSEYSGVGKKQLYEALLSLKK